MIELPAKLSEEQIQKDLNAISTTKNKNERLSWKRKYDKMQEVIANEIKPLEDSILTILEKKMQAADRLEDLRKQMVKECVHPKNSLVHRGDHVECKFCNVKLSLPR
jgi:hypothetical protein